MQSLVTNDLMLIAVTIVACGLPMGLLAVLMATQTRRIRPLMFGATAMGAGVLGGVIGGGMLMEPSGGPPADSLWFGVLIGLVVMAAIEVVAALLGRWIGLMLVTPVEQSGQLYWWCGYDLGAEAIGICPECAEPKATHLFRTRWRTWVWRGLCRVGPWAAAVVLLSGGGWMAHRIVNVWLPCQRFTASIGRHGGDLGFSYWPYIADDAMFSGTWTGVLATREVPGRSDVRIGYAFFGEPARSKGRPVRMRVFLCEPTGKGTATLTSATGATSTVEYDKSPSEGSIRVYADLDERQAAMVVRNGGAPEPLIREILAAAEKAGWKSAGPGAEGPTWSAERVRVNPEGHFTGEGKGAVAEGGR